MKHYIHICLVCFCIMYTPYQYPMLRKLESCWQVHKALAPEYKHLSPLFGAITWENNLANRIHLFGKCEATPRGQWLPNASGNVQLTYALFTRILNNFDVSKNPSYPAKHISEGLCSHIIAALEAHRMRTTMTPTESLEQIILQDKEFVDSRIKTAQKLLHAKSQQIHGSAHDHQSARAKYDTQRLSRRHDTQQKIAQLERRRRELQELAGREKQRAQKELARINKDLEQLRRSNATGDCNRVHELAQALVHANTPAWYHPTSATYALLHTFMYRKAKDPDYALKYGTILEQKLGHPIGKDGMSIATYLHAIQPTHVTISRIEHAICHEHDIPGLLTRAYEDMVYMQIIERNYKGPLPKITLFSMVPFMEQEFSNCMEVALFNLCNIVLYDKEREIFAIEKAPTEMMHPAVKRFYEDAHCKSAHHTECPHVHRQWTHTVCHQPFVTYRRMIYQDDTGRTVIAVAPRDTEGFIYGLPSDTLDTLEHNGNRINIAGRWYIFIGPTKGNLYEMHPTVRNLIIMMDMLFGLNLFHGAREAAFLSPIFNERYLPELCKRIKPMQTLNLSQIGVAALNICDYSNAKIFLPFKQFSIVLAKDDANINKHIKGIGLDNTIQKFAPLITSQQNPTFHAFLRLLLSLFSFDIDKIPESNRCDLVPLVDIDLQDQPILIELFKHALRNRLIQAASPDQQDFLMVYIAQILKNLPHDLDYHSNIFEEFDPMLINNPEIRMIVDDTVQRATHYIYHGTEIQREPLMRFFAAISGSLPGHYQAERLAAAQYGIKQISSRDRKYALHIFMSLVRENSALHEAVTCAVMSITNHKRSNRILTLQLIDELNAHGMCTVLEAALHRHRIEILD